MHELFPGDYLSHTCVKQVLVVLYMCLGAAQSVGLGIMPKWLIWCRRAVTLMAPPAVVLWEVLYRSRHFPRLRFVSRMICHYVVLQSC